MIYNERQQKITSSQIEKLRLSLDALKQTSDKDWITKAQIDALSSQITDLSSELSEYSLIKQGKVKYNECNDLSNLPKVLIQARIAKNYSQKDLADELGMTAQQVQRYEASNYMGASLSRLIEVSDILNIQIKESWGSTDPHEGNAIFSWSDKNHIDWSKFPVKEMIKKGWIELKGKASVNNIIEEFFTHSAGNQYITALHRKKFYGKNSPNEFALLAWQARILNKARNEYNTNNVSKFELDDTWLKDLVSLTKEPDSLIAVRELLAKKGIILVNEEHLSGTYLDGAAMLLETGNPVIGLTLRLDRLDNFWFVLMHELGHIFLHLFDSLNLDFFDEQNGVDEDEIEKEADDFALNNLIPEDLWNQCLSRFSVTEKSVMIDAENLDIHPSIIAGRIRKEQNNYTILSNLVGQGKVRKSFGV